MFHGAYHFMFCKWKASRSFQLLWLPYSYPYCLPQQFSFTSDICCWFCKYIENNCPYKRGGGNLKFFCEKSCNPNKIPYQSIGINWRVCEELGNDLENKCKIAQVCRNPSIISRVTVGACRDYSLFFLRLRVMVHHQRCHEVRRSVKTIWGHPNGNGNN